MVKLLKADIEVLEKCQELGHPAVIEDLKAVVRALEWKK